MENIDPNQAKRVWSRVLAQEDAPEGAAQTAENRFAPKVLAAMQAQKEDLALYRYLMRRLCSPALGNLKTLAEHTECRIKTLGAVYYLETGKKACAEREKSVCIACANEALRQQYERVAAQAEAYRALGEEMPGYACEMDQLAGLLCCDKKLILEILFYGKTMMVYF